MTDRTRDLRRFLAICLALAAVALAGISLERKIKTFQPLGFSAVRQQSTWRVEAVDAATTEVESGDLIILVNGRSPGEIDDLGAALRRQPQSELMVQRGDELTTVSYLAPALEIDYPFLVLATIGIGFLLIGLYTLLRDRERPARLFYLWCLTSAVVYLVTPTQPFDIIGRALFIADELARVLLAPLTLHLFLVVPRPARGVRRWVPFVYLPAAVLLLLQSDLVLNNGAWLFADKTAGAVALLDRLELVHLTVLSVAAVAVLIWRLLATRELEHRRQLTWIALGMGCGYTPFAALYVLPHAAGFDVPMPLATLAVVPLALVPTTFAYGVLRYRLWDIGVIVRETVSLSLTILVGVLGFSLINLVINRVVPDELNLARNLLSFASGLAIAGLVLPARKGIAGSLERLQYRSNYDRRRAFADLGRELLHERDLKRLGGILLGQLRFAIGLTSANLYLKQDQGWQAIERAGDRDAYAPELGDLDPAWWDEDVLELADTGPFDGDERPAESRLARRGYRYLFPLSSRGRHIGFVVTGNKAEGLPLNSDDLDLLRSVFNQAALALENAQLMGEVREQLDEVSRLKEYSQSIIESSPAALVVLDRRGLIRSANAAFSELVEHPLEELSGNDLHRVLPIESLPSPSEGMREVSFRDAHDRERYLQVSQAEQTDGERVVVLQDITQQVAVQRELQEKEHLAALGLLAAGVAHEVNTPITGISSYAQMLLANTAEDDPRRELLAKLEKQSFRASRIVNTLLDFARKKDERSQVIDLRPLIGECLGLLSDTMLRRSVELEWTTPEGPVEVYGNEIQLQQVMTNLALNAVEAMTAQGGGELSVRLTAEPTQATICVEDTGPGIPPERLGKIFEPFYSTKTDQGGTGLGLSISYAIVEQHHGALRVENRADCGCRFVLTLPRAAVPTGGATPR